MLRVLIVSAVVGLTASSLPGQTPAQTEDKPAGLILGRVVDATSGRPIPLAVVAISPGQGQLTAAATRRLTDRNGAFLFRALPNGRYTLTASKGGYSDGAYGRKVPNGLTVPIVLTDAQRTIDMTVPMWRSASLSGAVVDEAGEPIVNVTVKAYRRTARAGARWLISARSAVTDDRGAYRMWNLAPGEYVVGVESTSVTLPVGVADAYEQGLRTSAPGQNPLSMVMYEAGALGVLTPANTVRNGTLLRTLGRGPVPPPLAESGRSLTYPTTFYPSIATSASAATITLGSGEERTAIDLQVKPVPSARITGIVQGPDGPVPHVVLKLVPAGGDDLFTEIETSNTVTDAAGAFTLLGVPAGQYTLRVTSVPPPAPGSATSTVVQVGGSTMVSSVVMSGNAPPATIAPAVLWASIPVSVGTRDVTGVDVDVRPGPRVSGRFEFDGAAERPRHDQMPGLVRLEPASGRGAVRTERAGVEADGTFTSMSVPGGRYYLRVSNSPGWYLRAATLEGKDITDTPVDLQHDLRGVVVTFTDRPTELSGIVTGASGSPDPDAVVLVFPSDTASWREWGLTPRRMRAVRTDPSGRYTFPALPPGDYYLVALPAERANEWQDARMLAALARDAATISVSEGDKNTHDLRTRAGAR